MSDDRRKLTYIPSLNAGHILTALSMAGTIVVMCCVFYAREAVRDYRINTLETVTTKMAVTMEAIAANQSRTTVLIEELRKERGK